MVSVSAARKRFSVLACILASVVFAGCGGDHRALSERFAPDPANDDAAGDAIGPSDRNGSNLSIVECAAESLCTALRRTYVGRDLEGYSRLFTPDFTFVFSPPDVHDPENPTPAQWGLADELGAHDHLFHDEYVFQISLSLWMVHRGRPRRSRTGLSLHEHRARHRLPDGLARRLGRMGGDRGSGDRRVWAHAAPGGGSRPGSGRRAFDLGADQGALPD